MANIALCFDADKTLLKDYHPRLIFERRNLDFDSFLSRVRELEANEKLKGEKTRLDIVYLAQFMYEVRHGSLQGLTMQEIKEAGKDLDKMLYPGLPEFFDKIKEANPQHNISYHIISVGLKDLLEASVLGKYVNSIFGYTFFDNLTPSPVIDEIKSTASAVEKVSALVTISKGDDENLFKWPLAHMKYFDDGQTGIPAFSFLRGRHGECFAVYDSGKPNALEKTKVSLGKYVDHIVPADFRENSELFKILNESLQGTQERIIRKKCWPDLFKRMKKGHKTAEVRLADFHAEPGDIFIAQEWDPETRRYTGEEIRCRVRNANKVDLRQFHTKAEIMNNNYWILDLS